MIATHASTRLSSGCMEAPSGLQRPLPQWNTPDAISRAGRLHQLLRRLKVRSFGSGDVNCGPAKRQPLESGVAAIKLPRLHSAAMNSGGKLIAGIYGALTAYPAVRHLLSQPADCRPREFALSLEVDFKRPISDGDEAEFFLSEAPAPYLEHEGMGYRTEGRLRPRGSEEDWKVSSRASVSFVPTATGTGFRTTDFRCLCNRNFGFSLDLRKVEVEGNQVSLALSEGISGTEAMFVLFLMTDVAAINYLYVHPRLVVRHRIITAHAEASFTRRPGRCKRLTFNVLEEPKPVLHVNRAHVTVRCYGDGNELGQAMLTLVNVEDRDGKFVPVNFGFNDT